MEATFSELTNIMHQKYIYMHASKIYFNMYEVKSFFFYMLTLKFIDSIKFSIKRNL